MATPHRRISVVGLGYVGLPVAVAFGLKRPVVGFDVNETRIESLKSYHDWTHEITSEQLKQAQIHLTTKPEDLRAADFHIIAVPTPVDEAHKPDLSALEKASELVGAQLKKGDIVVYESTVYPGATEEICMPILERLSGLTCGKDFSIGYSPERINPGDKEHSFSSITKVVSGVDAQCCDLIAKVYGEVVEAGIYQASSIKVAEAAKVIENTQRDLNIALMNELSMIFDRMHIDTHEVLKAAGTKWNFLKFSPGLVGGHCIGVDPYYLTFKAKQLGYRPEVILAGRRINDGMGKYVAEHVIKTMIQRGNKIKDATVAVLGLTFKENCPDLRNSKVIDVIRELQSYGVNIIVHDPLASTEEAFEHYGLRLTHWESIPKVDGMVVCVAHKHYLELSPREYQEKLKDSNLLFDVKGQLDRPLFESQAMALWRL